METKEYSMKAQKRDENGLLEGVTYIFNEDGTINWRAMVDPVFLVPNKQRTQETDISKLKDGELLILLGGLKKLARLRGFSEVTFPTVQVQGDRVTAVCRIEWIPNYETEGRAIVREAMADANFDNTDEMTKWHLAAMAENRAFVRAVRNFLEINIVSKEEINDKKKEQEDAPSKKKAAVSDPRTTLKEACEKKNVGFDKVIAKLEKMGVDVSDISTFEDIPKAKVLELIDAVNNYQPKA